MNQCLYCHKPCAEAAVFCNSCRISLLNRQHRRKKASQQLSSSVQAEYSNTLERTEIRQIPYSASLPDTDSKDQFATISSASIIPDSDQPIDLSQLMPDDWPELAYVNTNDNASDSWLKQVDPLMARQLPVGSTDIAYEEAEFVADASPAKDNIAAAFPAVRRKSVPARWRLIFAILIVTIVLALIADAILITISSPRAHNLSVLSSPQLTVTPRITYPGQQVLLQISHFSSFAHVFLTRDIQESVRTNTNTSLISLNAAGSAEVHILIEKSWATGMHTIEGEDVTTRYTTSTTIQVLGGGSPEPPRLTMDQNRLDMSADLQGANTIQSFTLHNVGNASISWLAGSNQPWLMTTPVQGVFSDSQTISVAVTRAHLSPGQNYRGTITFVSNVGEPMSVHVSMAVLALPYHPSAVLQVTPPALAFTTTDGGANPTNQTIAISNPGSQPLSWSYAGSSSIASSTQVLSPQPNNWLTAATTSGVVAPGSTQQITMQVQSQNLLTGVYSDLVTFSTIGAGLNNPQHIAVSITVQPRTSVSPTPTVQSTGNTKATATPTQQLTAPPGAPIINTIVPDLNFTYTQGQSMPGKQSVSIANIGGSPFSWQASISPSAPSWLSITPNNGTIAANQTYQMHVSVNPTQLQPGSYRARVIVNATDSSGAQIQNSPQMLTVTLIVYASCSLQVIPAALSFSTSLLSPISSSQSVILRGVGNCNNSVLWTANGSQPWLILSTTNGNGNGSISVHVNSQGLLLGKFTAQIKLAAVDNNNVAIPVNPQTISVTLIVSAT